MRTLDFGVENMAKTAHFISIFHNVEKKATTTTTEIESQL